MRLRYVVCALFITVLVCTSCSKIEKAEGSADSVLTVTDSVALTTEKTGEDSTTELFVETEDTEVILPNYIGIYDDLQNNGSYTKLSSWTSPWISGRDIAVFDIIPSFESTLAGPSYSRLWKEAKELIPDSVCVSPYFILEYTLADTTVVSREIRSYIDSEELISEGYLEVYLYDDVANANSSWYSHLTETDTDENTVITSLKLTGGKNIDEVVSISLTVCNEGSAPYTVELFKE